MKKNKWLSLLIILFIYIIAGVAAYFSYKYLPFEFYLNLFISDVLATTIVFIFSLIFKNASCYDAYWSVAPMVIVMAYLFTKPLNSVRLLASIAILGWGLRLTLNWIYTFDNLEWEDWRYKMLKEKSGKLYPIINFLGIHLFPTIVVYFCILPFAYLYHNDVTLNAFTIIFFSLAILSFSMQGVADYEMHKFRKNKNSVFIRNGLWKYSRHPNYLGEILMWWSIGLLAIFSLGGYYYLITGAIINTCMFVFISIPLAEGHQKDRKEGFLEYKKETRMLLPIYKRKPKEEEKIGEN